MHSSKVSLSGGNHQYEIAIEHALMSFRTAIVMVQVIGVSNVLSAEHPCLENCLPEPTAELLANVQRRHNYSHVMTPSSAFGKSVLPRAAALLNLQPISDVIQIVDCNTFVRPIYAGNALQTVQLEASGAAFLSVRPTAFPVDSSQLVSPSPAQIAKVLEEDISTCQLLSGTCGAQAIHFMDGLL